MIKKRKDCFWGMHMDFHAKPAEGIVIGANTTEADIREICEIMRPDFMQIDCKGHPGWASYPSKMGNAMPHIAGDPLATFRKVTKEYGVALYMHYSGVYEKKYFAEHPELSVMDADGNYTDGAWLNDRTYLDELLVPQISELVDKYEIDGIWTDGDCWYARPDYRPETIADFEKTTGINLNGQKPRSMDDPYFKEYLDYTREQFRGFLKYFVDKLHAKYPDLQICSNWAYSHHMFEEIKIDVDFLSGDFFFNNCPNSARFAGRCLAQHNVPWDLMAYGMRFLVYNTPLVPSKYPAQMMQDVAEVIAIGGSVQELFSQHIDGSPSMNHWRTMKPVADFVRAREPFCFRGKLMPQIAMLASKYDREYEMPFPYCTQGTEKWQGLTSLICEAGHSLEIVSEHRLARGKQCPIMVVPELYKGVGADTVAELRDYVENGGNLVLVGSNTAQFFSENGFPFTADYDVPLPEILGFANCDIGHEKGTINKSIPTYFSLDNLRFGVTVGACHVKAEGETVGQLCHHFDHPGVPFAKIIPMGKGKLAVIAANIGSEYAMGTQKLHRDLFNRIADAMYVPMVKLEQAKDLIEVVALEKDGKRMIQLINSNGQHANERCVTEDHIPPALDIDLSIACDTAPTALIWQPEGKPLAFTYRDGRAYTRIDRLDIHNVIEVVE